MPITKSGLNSILILACFLGYLWVFFVTAKHKHSINSTKMCIIKSATDVPCPSCGTSRSVVSLINADFFQALKLNPIGYLVAAIMLVSPLWILFDFVKRSNTLLSFYIKLESYFKKPSIAITAVSLIFLNWVWNIVKGV